MLKSLFAMAAIAAAPPLQAEEATRQKVYRAGSQVSSIGPAERFSGRVQVEPVFATTDELPAAAYVSFEAGARSAWHSHPAGQRLLVVSGTGRTQQWGGPVQVIAAGDVVVCPPGVKHWHGAAPTTGMTHLAITPVAEGQAVEWMEKVSDEDYGHADQALQQDQATMTTATPAQPAVTLTAQQQSIPLIGAAAASSDMPALNAALARGLDAGLSISEAREILVQLYAYAGFPRSLNALGELMKVLEQRRAQGIHDAPGRDPAAQVPTGEALLALGRQNQTRISGRPVQGPLFDFAPIINQYLQTHLFGDIFARDNLDWQSRELATVGALAATPGAEAQLRSHMGASLRVGLSRPQLNQLVELLEQQGLAGAAPRARVALDAQPPQETP